MPRRKKETTKADQLLDELLQDYSGPEQILGEGGLLKQLTSRLVDRLIHQAVIVEVDAESFRKQAAARRNSAAQAATTDP